MNIANDQKALDANVIVWQPHCKDSSCQSVRFKEKKKFLDKIFGKKQFYLFPIKFIRISRRIKQGEHRQFVIWSANVVGNVDHLTACSTTVCMCSILTCGHNKDNFYFRFCKCLWHIFFLPKIKEMQPRLTQNHKF